MGFDLCPALRDKCKPSSFPFCSKSQLPADRIDRTVQIWSNHPGAWLTVSGKTRAQELEFQSSSEARD